MAAQPITQATGGGTKAATASSPVMNVATPPRRTAPTARKTAQRLVTCAPEPVVSSPFRPRLYALHPLQAGPVAGWGPLLSHAASLGFDHVVCPPPFASAQSGNLFLIDDPDHGDARISPGDGYGAVHEMARAARVAGLELMLDVTVDRIAADGVLAAERPGWIAASEVPGPGPDPRYHGAAGRTAWIRLEDAEAASWWISRLTLWVKAGVAGFVLRDAHRAPAGFWRSALAAVRHATRPGTRFLAWIPGATAEEIARLDQAGLDGVFSSLAWWDCRAPWLAEEYRRLSPVAPVLAAPEVPFGPRAAHDDPDPERRRRHACRALHVAAAIGAGLMLAMGFEFGARRRLDPTRGTPEDYLLDRSGIDLSAAIAAANRRLAALPVADRLEILGTPGSGATALLRRVADGPAHLVLINADAGRPARVRPAPILAATGGITCFDGDEGHDGLRLGTELRLEPAEVRVLRARVQPPVGTDRPPRRVTIEQATARPRIAIEAVAPVVDDGRFPAKRTVGEMMCVEADVFADGHDKLAAELLWRAADDREWRRVRMTPLGNDRWAADMPLERLGRHVFMVEAWRDAFATLRDELEKKHQAGLNLSLELEEARRFVVDTAAAAAAEEYRAALETLAGRLADSDDDGRLGLMLAPETAGLLAAADRRPFAVRTEAMPVDAERLAARFAAWYELFPRSAGNDASRHGTFADVVGRLADIRDMGFDVLYFPPIHPIGREHRKGPNNTLTAGRNDPGSPYAIGSAEGGHDAVHPELGTLDDFRRLRIAAADHGLELALDFAIQCAPDHPWLRDHPGWFAWRPDGSLRYAENPPKKYQDIVNVDFYAGGAIPDLWAALRDVVLFWVAEGVRLFRVDNPHTKPFPFWEWLIADVRGRHPDVIFLSEAFTRPKVMYRLAKIGFSQSYTYFTWRHSAREFTDYLTELTTTAPKDFFRPHFFVNTPDINPYFLQRSGRAGFVQRAALAATLSGLWGLYSGFELCEAEPLPGKEEYLDSEKFQLRVRDWNQPGNIKAEIALLNRIRRANPALHTHLGLTFLPASDDRILCFVKATPDRGNIVLVAINLDPHETREAGLELPLWRWGLDDDAAFTVDDLVTDQTLTWQGKWRTVRLDPARLAFAAWRLALPAEG